MALQTLEATNADSKSGQVKVRTPRYENYHFGRFLGTMSGDLKLLILRSVRVLAREWMVGITFDHRYPFFGELAFGHSVL